MTFLDPTGSVLGPVYMEIAFWVLRNHTGNVYSMRISHFLKWNFFHGPTDRPSNLLIEILLPEFKNISKKPNKTERKKKEIKEIDKKNEINEWEWKYNYEINEKIW